MQVEIMIKGEPGMVNWLWRNAVNRLQRAEAPVWWELSGDRWDFATESPGYVPLRWSWEMVYFGRRML